MAAITYTARRGASLLGDELGAWMADDTAETLVGNELVTNGTFDTDTTGWTAVNNATLSVVGARLRVAYNGTAIPIALQTITTVVGKTYQILSDGFYSTEDFAIIAKSSNGLTTIYSSGTLSATTTGILGYFVAVDISPTIQLWVLSSSNYAEFDNISIRLAVPDLSAENNGLGVYGSITKSAVNTGAGLMGYGGWSTSNYLEQPYNSALDFGTGDFCYMGWFMVESTTTKTPAFFQRTDSAGATYGTIALIARLTTGGVLFVNVATATYTGTIDYRDDEFHHLAVARVSGVAYVYIDGSLVTSFAAAGTVTDTAGVLKFGILTYNSVLDTTGALEGDLALWKVSTGRTAAQIKSIYNDEKHLFEPYSKYTQIGVDYSLDVDLSSRGMSRMSNRSENKPIQGPSEVLLFNDWREWDVTNTPRTRADMAEVTEFLTSTLDGGTITFDPYGTAAAPDTPLTCQVDGDSFSESETILGWRQISFKVRET